VLKYRAPWSARVTILTIVGTVALAGEAALMWFLASRFPTLGKGLTAVAAGCLFVFLWCALEAVRGYGFDTGVLVIYRSVWTTRVSLEGLRSVAEDPEAMRLTATGFGNGGLFAVWGWRHVAPYGWCRVFGTDPNRAVVLSGEGFHYIVTPDRPAEFAAEARQWCRPA
jgi:hypothetical protein